MAFFTTSFILFALAGLALLGGVALFLRRHARFALAFVALALALAAAGSIVSYREAQDRAVKAYATEVDAGRKPVLVKRYREAAELLREISLSKPDKDALAKAVTLLLPFENEKDAQIVASDCPDAQTLLLYAKALQMAGAYDGHMTNRNVAENEALQKLAAAIPERYSGDLADKILPFRHLIENMKREAEREAERDAENAKAHEQAMKEGRYGDLRPGDAEERIEAAMGEPERVNVSETAEGEIKQYVFLHNSKYVYVYTKQGVVTEIK